MTQPIDAGLRWDEPPGATTPRGWLHNAGNVVGYYLDYESGHYRVGHKTDIGSGRIVSFCKPNDLCKDCQPGNILCVRYPNGPGTQPHTFRWCTTIEQARRFIETGRHEEDDPAYD